MIGANSLIHTKTIFHDWQRADSIKGSLVDKELSKIQSLCLRRERLITVIILAGKRSFCLKNIFFVDIEYKHDLLLIRCGERKKFVLDSILTRAKREVTKIVHQGFFHHWKSSAIRLGLIK